MSNLKIVRVTISNGRKIGITESYDTINIENNQIVEQTSDKILPNKTETIFLTCIDKLIAWYRRGVAVGRYNKKPANTDPINPNFPAKKARRRKYRQEIEHSDWFMGWEHYRKNVKLFHQLPGIKKDWD